MNGTLSARLKRRAGLAIVVAGLGSAAGLMISSTASAHHADITASASCADGGGHTVNFTATAWEGDGTPESRTNPDIVITASIDGGAASSVGSGAFNAGNGFTFGGSFQVAPGASTVEVFALANGPWGNGNPGGTTNSTGPIALPAGCDPTTTTTSTTTTTTSTTTTSTTTTTTQPPGDDGCTPGYWKNHPSAWQGYSPGQATNTVFAGTDAYGLGSQSLLTSLSGSGGSDTTGAARILLRAATAAVLNAAHADVDYPQTAAEIIADVNAALASGDRATILSLASSLDADNNLGCPL